MKDAVGQVQSALVLGGTSEIALATVRALADQRLRRVVLAARDEQRAAAAGAELAAVGVRVETVAFDAADPVGPQAVVEKVFGREGDIDVVLLAFGVLGDQERDELDPAATRAVIDVNFTAAASTMVSVTDRLRRQGHGTLVVLSSVAAERPRRANFVYGSSKAGLDAFAQGLSDAVQGSGVRVLVVRPGFVHTRMTAGMDAAPFATTPDVVATAIVDGLRSGAHTVWAPAKLRYVMAVLRHLPRPVFRRLGS